MRTPLLQIQILREKTIKFQSKNCFPFLTDATVIVKKIILWTLHKIQTGSLFNCRIHSTAALLWPYGELRLIIKGSAVGSDFTSLLELELEASIKHLNLQSKVYLLTYRGNYLSFKMPDYSPTEIVDMLLILGESQNNHAAAARLYAQRFPDRQHPAENTFRNVALRARDGQLTRERSHHVFDENDVRALTILACVHLNPHTSSRQLERETGIPRTTILRILKASKYHAYHITLTQALSQADMVARVQFCRWAVEMIRQDNDFFRYVLFSDEATFKSNGELNRHNCHYWSEVNPHWYRAVDNQHRWSIMVWCGIVNGNLIGPYFFDENVTGESFLRLLRDYLYYLLLDVDAATQQRMWFQMDGAGPHYARVVRDFLNLHYPGRWIGRGGPVVWPARSPDLTPPDFYLWGYIKNLVYAQQPTTREDMIQRIRIACAQIPRGVLLKTVDNFRERVNLCIQANGDNFEQLLRG